MRSSELGLRASYDPDGLRLRRFGRRRHLSRGVTWCVLICATSTGLMFAVVGALGLFAPGAQGMPPVWVDVALLVGGLGWAYTAGPLFHRSYLREVPADGRRVGTGTVDGRGATVLAWSLSFLHASAVGVPVVGVVCVVVAVGAGASGSSVLAVVSGGIGALCLYLACDSVLRLRRKPYTALTVDGLTVHGIDGDASLPWHDLLGSELTAIETWQVLRLHARPGAEVTWTPRPRLQPVPRQRTWLDIPLPSLDVPPRLLMATILYFQHTPSARHELADGTAARRLASLDWPPAPSAGALGKASDSAEEQAFWAAVRINNQRTDADPLASKSLRDDLEDAADDALGTDGW